MKVVMTQAVCPEGLAMLEGKADIYVADNGDPNNYLDEMKDADALIYVSRNVTDIPSRTARI